MSDTAELDDLIDLLIDSEHDQLDDIPMWITIKVEVEYDEAGDEDGAILHIQSSGLDKYGVLMLLSDAQEAVMEEYDDDSDE